MSQVVHAGAFADVWFCAAKGRLPHPRLKAVDPDGAAGAVTNSQGWL